MLLQYGFTRMAINITPDKWYLGFAVETFLPPYCRTHNAMPTYLHIVYSNTARSKFHSIIGVSIIHVTTREWCRCLRFSKCQLASQSLVWTSGLWQFSWRDKYHKHCRHCVSQPRKRPATLVAKYLHNSKWCVSN